MNQRLVLLFRYKVLLQFLRYVILIAISLVVLFPIYWMLTSSVKPLTEIITIPYRWLPSEIRLENYTNAWNSGPFPRYTVNSVIFTVCATLGNVVFASLAGYGFSKFRWRGRGLAFLFVLSTMMLPVEVIFIPLYLVTRSLGWLNTYHGLIIPIMIDAFAIFFMRQYITTIPDDYIDSARLDGASELQIFMRIVVPISRPAIAALILIKALVNWDQVLWPLAAVTEKKLQVLTVGVAFFQQHIFTPDHERIALGVILSVPMLIFLVLAQRQIVEMSALSGMR